MVFTETAHQSQHDASTSVESHRSDRPLAGLTAGRGRPKAGSKQEGGGTTDLTDKETPAQEEEETARAGCELEIVDYFGTATNRAPAKFP